MQREIRGTDLTPFVCAEKFNNITERLDDGDAHFHSNDEILSIHNTDIAVLRNNMVALTGSLKGLAVAIWGACCTLALTGIGFVVWYIQNK